MLDLVRKKQKSVFIKVAFAVIILSFVIGYAMLSSPDGAGGNDPSVAATVNGTPIGYSDFQSAYSNLYRLYQEIYRDQFTPGMEKQLGLRRQALDALVEQTLLLQEAKNLGLSVSRQELVASIAEISAFHENGSFSRDRYLQVLNAQRLSPESFEEMQRRQLLADKVRQKIQEGITVSDEQIVQEFRDRNEKINLAFVRLAPARFEKKVQVDRAALEKFYAERREEFRLPEQVSLEYIVFSPERFAGEVTFTDEELEKYYRRNLDAFDIPEQVRAAHILIKVPQDAEPALKEKKREQAAKILAEARSGSEFGRLAKKHSEDAGSVANGGDLGFFARGTMVAPFEQAAFALPPGEISDLVETPFGYHIIRTVERIEPRVRPLAEVQEEVKAGLQAEKAGQLAYEKAMDAYNINRQGGSLAKASEENGLRTAQTGLFDRQGSPGQLGDAPEVVAAAFELQPGQLARPLRVPQGVVLFTVKERQETRVPELAEVRGAVEETFRREEAREIARRAAEEILSGAKQGGKLADLAARQGEKAEETGFFTRAYGAFVPRIGSSEELAKAAFALTGEAPVADQVFELDGRFVVLRLKERQEAPVSTLDDQQRQELREALLTRNKSQAVETRLQELREKAEITYSIALEGENS